MNIVQSILLGAIQGVTEFLPISSSGHLILLAKIFDFSDSTLTFSIIVHLGSLIAIIIFFWREITKLIQGVFYCSNADSLDRKLAWIIIGASVPVALTGFLIANLLEGLFYSAEIIAYSLIFWGMIMWFAERKMQNVKNKLTTINKISWRQGLLIGVAQIFSLIPGTSRSGVTMTAAMYQGIDRVTATKFSFLLGMPAIFGAGSFKLISIWQNGSINELNFELICGFFSSAIFSWLAINFLLKIIQKRGFDVFVLYRLISGGLILLFV